MMAHDMRRRQAVTLGAVLAALALGTTPLGAQPVVNEQPTAPVQLGPLYLTPALAIRGIGVDSNVFNDDSEEQDLTATIGADLDAVVLLGQGRATGFMNTDYVWYQEFSSERSVNTTTGGRFEVFLTRLHPWVEASLLASRERPGFEIDARARRTEPSYRGGVDLRLGSRSGVAFSARRDRTNFAAGEEFADVALDETLNNTSQAYTVAYRMELTPLTIWSVEAEYQTDRFDTAANRDADSYLTVTRLAFDPDALLAGEVSVGIRDYEPQDPTLEGFRGLVADGALTYTFADVTQIAAQFSRNVNYSFEVDEPYYVETGATLTITQQLLGPLDIVGGAGRQRLSYQTFVDRATDRADTVTTYRLGVGYRLGETLRFGVDGELTKRRSTTRPDRRYDRTRFYGSVAYAL